MVKRPVPKPVRRAAPVKSVASEYQDMTVEQLTAIIEKASEAREAKLGDERRAFIDETKRRAAMLGVTMSFGDDKPKGVRKAVEVKYRHGEDSWTGRGRLPRWLQALEAEGHKREEFAV